MRKVVASQILGALFALSLALPAVSAPDSPGANKNSAGAQAESDVDFGPYMAAMQKSIKRAWFPPRGEESKRVTVLYKINKDGRVINIKVDKPSGVKGCDEAAVQAIKNAAPFHPLPAGAPPVVDIQFTFDYNVFEGAKSFDSAAESDKNMSGEGLIELAKREKSEEKFDSAIAHYKLAIERLRTRANLDRNYLEEQLTALGDIYYEDVDNYEAAVPLYEESLSLVEKAPKHTEMELAAARRNLAYALLYRDDDHINDARELFNQALTVAQAEHNEDMVVDLKQGLAHCYWKDSEHEKALALYQYVLQAKSKSEPDDAADLGYRSKDVADCLYELKQYKESMPYLAAARDYLQKAGKTSDDEFVDAKAKLNELQAKFGAVVVKKDAEKAKDKAYAWLPFAMGGALLALLVISLSSKANNSDVDLTGRKKNS